MMIPRNEDETDLLADLAFPEETAQREQEAASGDAQFPQVPVRQERLSDEDRLTLALEYLGGRSVRDRRFDSRTWRRRSSEPRRAWNRSSSRGASSTGTSGSPISRDRGSTPARSNGTSGEFKAALSTLQAEARDEATALRSHVKEMAWEHGADVARLEILRSWWRKARDDSRKAEPSPNSESGRRPSLRPGRESSTGSHNLTNRERCRAPSWVGIADAIAGVLFAVLEALSLRLAKPHT